MEACNLIFGISRELDQWTGADISDANLLLGELHTR